MRLKLAAFAVLLLAGLPLKAQETYCSTANANQAADVRLHVLGVNRETCERLVPLSGPSFNCTQAAACTAANAAGGSGCSPAQARQASARIWPDSQAGREEFQSFEWDLPQFVTARASLPQRGYTAYCRWWSTATQVQREADCTKANLPITGTIQACSICS